MSVRVVIADDQTLVRDGIASLLALEHGIDVVAVAAGGKDAVALAIELRPDVVLMDVRMPDLDGIAAVAILRRSVPDTRIMMLTTFDDEDYVLGALRAGAIGYLLKDLPASELADAVRLAAAGISLFGEAAARRLASSLSGEKGASPASDSLTDRESDVLRLIATGASNREIATRLHLSEGTVKNHVSRILTRLGLRDRTQAALYAREQGLLR
jgi:DNA-binding NarL/FixJ family response regulator